MPLNTFITIPPDATQAGAPITATVADALRENDHFFEQYLKVILATPLIPKAATNEPTVSNPSAIAFINTREVLVNTPIDVATKAPLIWLATEKITISDTINATGKGAQGTETGDFGGSGGGHASTVGRACLLPLSNHLLLPGGINSDTDINRNGKPLTEDLASRALSILAFCKGGATGAEDGTNAGGTGGGVVFLCAPEIEITSSGSIEANGTNGVGGNAGGGGGGLIVLITYNLIENGNLSADGGNGVGTGGKGGDGLIWKIVYS